jgi:RNA polymerase sigma factor (TIGR02999 family)
MENTQKTEVTKLLLELQKGNTTALTALIPVVYSELQRLASICLRGSSQTQTLRTTDLVHEAFFKLVGSENTEWESRAHFFGAAANAMRQILVDEARKRASVKRGGHLTKVSLDEGAILNDETAEQIVALDEALNRLFSLDERLGRIVELRFFSGLTIEETANLLGLSPATIKRDWHTARVFLYRMMTDE